MTTKRVSAPFDLMKQLSSGADQPKKRTTLTTQQTLVGSQTAPKSVLSKQKTLVQQPKLAQKQVSAPKSAQKQVSATKSTQKPVPASATAKPKQPPPRKAFTNGLFKPLTDKQVDMLEREYYTNKNMVGRDKLFFVLKRKHGDKAPTQKSAEGHQ